jgi:hypothetical protein
MAANNKKRSRRGRTEKKNMNCGCEFYLMEELPRRERLELGLVYPQQVTKPGARYLLVPTIHSRIYELIQ